MSSRALNLRASSCAFWIFRRPQAFCLCFVKLPECSCDVMFSESGSEMLFEFLDMLWYIYVACMNLKCYLCGNGDPAGINSPRGDGETISPVAVRRDRTGNFFSRGDGDREASLGGEFLVAIPSCWRHRTSYLLHLFTRFYASFSPFQMVYHYCLFEHLRNHKAVLGFILFVLLFLFILFILPSMFILFILTLSRGT